jgi:CheY-like chemotaxis protein
MGIRDAEAVDALAQRAGFALLADIAMPANNRCRVSRRLDAASVASDGAEAISTLFQTQDFDRKR